MIRNKIPQFIQSKHRYKNKHNRFSTNRDIIINQPWWFEQYYQQKQLLLQINNNNRNITLLTRQYQTNPSIYSLQKIQKLITDNCQNIQYVDKWINQFMYSNPNNNQILYKSQKIMNTHLQNVLAQQILNLFSNKQIITSVNQEIQNNNSVSFSRSRIVSPSYVNANVNNTSFNGHNASFNINNTTFNANNNNNNSFINNTSFNQNNATATLNNPSNKSYSPLHNNNPLNTSYQPQDRNMMFQQVNTKIQNLNLLLRRMNTMVVGQGDLINRIDQNLVTGKNNLVKANQQLKTRADREEGTGQFTCQGKINKVITGLYVVNLVIILLFLLKHLIF